MYKCWAGNTTENKTQKWWGAKLLPGIDLIMMVMFASLKINVKRFIFYQGI